jgi:hypothetical protein
MSTSVSVSQKSTPKVSVTTSKSVKSTIARKTPVVVKTPASKTAAVVKTKVVTGSIATASETAALSTTSAEAESEIASESTTTKVHVEAKKRRRPRQRAFADIFAQVVEDNNVSYKKAQAVNRTLKSLESAHNREVHSSKSRTTTTRTPTIIFDQVLVDYITSRLNGSELTVNRKEGETETVVDLSDLSTDTRVHRTDVTQLYNKIFIKHDMRNPDDRRFVLYQNDKDLVSLLTKGSYKPELEEDVQGIRDGTYKLTIFNIQRFTSHHVGKVALAAKISVTATTATTATTA